MKLTINGGSKNYKLYRHKITNIYTLKLLNVPINTKILDITHEHENGFNYVYENSQLIYELHTYVNLVKLKIDSHYFNQMIDHTYNNLKYLYIESCIFDQDLECLPNLIELSITSNKFNSYLNNLPNILKKLIINSSIFNQELDLLPDSLRQLYVISNSFNKRLDDLPGDLKVLQLITKDFNKELKCLPSKLQNLIINMNENIKIEKIPDSLKKLFIIEYELLSDYLVNNHSLPSDYILKKSSKTLFKTNKLQIIACYENRIKHKILSYLGLISYVGIFSLIWVNHIYSVDNLKKFIQNNIKIDKNYIKYVGYDDNVYYTHYINNYYILYFIFCISFIISIAFLLLFSLFTPLILTIMLYKNCFKECFKSCFKNDD